MYQIGGQERQCPMCTKLFYADERYAYQMDSRFFCSWHCLRAYEKDKTAAQGTGKMIGKKASRIFDLLSIGKTYPEIGQELGIADTTVGYYVSKYKMRKQIREGNHELQAVTESML